MKKQGCIILLVLCVNNIVYGQPARVGINTATPQAALHVADSSVLFSYPSNLFYLFPNPPVSGSGSRMMWYAWRGAFRAGAVTGPYWDRDSTGIVSFASGNNVVSNGVTSAAFGNFTRAVGNNSIAMGNGTQALGSESVAMGYNCIAEGAHSFAVGSGSKSLDVNSVAMGFQTEAYGQGSVAFGNNTKTTGSFSSASAAFGVQTIATGGRSAVFGHGTTAESFASLTLGRYNLDSGLDHAWFSPDPVFIIGNGADDQNRHNALTMLKNGNLGLHTHQPTHRLHITNDNSNDGGHVEGIMIENTHPNMGEATLCFRNQSMPANKQWIVGINQGLPQLAFAYGSALTTDVTRLALDTLGRIGIRTTAPQAPLHVVRENPSGGVLNANLLAIFESNSSSFIQLSVENGDETGILSGNQQTAIRSAIIFSADSSMSLRAGGNTTDLKIMKDGKVGIATNTPTAQLDVNGNFALGINGTVLNEIIKATVNVNVPSVPANGGTIAQTMTVTNAATTSAVMVSPATTLNAGLAIASARVSSANTVEVRFVNTTASAIDPPVMDYYITVIR